jgi:hypothetical protein
LKSKVKANELFPKVETLGLLKGGISGNFRFVERSHIFCEMGIMEKNDSSICTIQDEEYYIRSSFGEQY